MSSERMRLRVLDIVENIELAQEYLGNFDLDEFTSDHLTRAACERCLQRLTEAAIKIGEEAFISVSPNAPFHEVRGMGNALRHAYDEIEAPLVFDTITKNLPPLLEDCQRWLAANPDPDA